MSKSNPLNGVIMSLKLSYCACVGTWATRFQERQVAEMENERGLEVNHSTIFRWVQRYAPELDKRIRPHLNPTNDSWRVDKTYIRGIGDKLRLWCICQYPQGMKIMPKTVEKMVFLGSAIA